MMPQIDGVEICRRIAAQATDQPPYIILLTGRDETADIVAGLEAGADDYITKPFEPEELHARINVGLRMLTMRAALADKVRELQSALADVRSLRGLLPTCAHCKKVRDDKGSRKSMEVYMHENGEVVYISGICPDCMKNLYPDYVQKS